MHISQTIGLLANLKWPLRVLLFVALVVGAMASTFVPTRSVESRIDAVTGSMTWKTDWWFGVTTGRVHHASAIEQRLIAMKEPWTPDWRFLHYNDYNVYGAGICYRCGMAPMIYRLQCCFDHYAASATDQQVRDFVKVMQNGSESEQNAALETAGTQAILHMSSE